MSRAHVWPKGPGHRPEAGRCAGGCGLVRERAGRRSWRYRVDDVVAGSEAGPCDHAIQHASPIVRAYLCLLGRADDAGASGQNAKAADLRRQASVLRNGFGAAEERELADGWSEQVCAAPAVKAEAEHLRDAACARAFCLLAEALTHAPLPPEETAIIAQLGLEMCPRLGIDHTKPPIRDASAPEFLRALADALVRALVDALASDVHCAGRPISDAGPRLGASQDD